MANSPIVNHVKQHIHKEFKSCADHEERQELISYILFLGLRHYHLIHPNQPVLRRLAVAMCEKAILDQDHVQNHQIQRGVKITLPQAQYEVPYPEHDGLHNVRKSRPDSMSHYPFTDEHGSVVDILRQEQLQERPDLLKIGGPGRKRIIEKTFEEMRCDRQGIRLSDLPEALSRVGIDLAPRVKKMLEKTRGNVVNGPLLLDEDDSVDPNGYVNPIMQQYMEKHIPLSLWKAIVKNFLIMRSQGVEPKHITQLIPIPRSAGSRQSDDGSTSYYDEQQVDRDDYFETLQPDFADEEDEEEEDNQAWEESKRPSRPKTAKKQHFDDDHNDDDDDFFLNHHHRGGVHRTRKVKKLTKKELEEQQREHSKKLLSQQSQQYQQQLKQVPSRIKDIIRHDKSSFHHSQHLTNSNALASLAKKRVDILTSTQPSSFRDPNYFSEADPRKARHNNKHGNQYKKISSLDSGMAALEIADAFLQGSVGKELLTTSESDLDVDYELGPKAAMKEASRMLGMKSRSAQHSSSNNNNMASRKPATSAPAASSSNNQNNGNHNDNISTFAHRTVKEKTIEKMLDEQSKHLYGSGWKASKNGWVADFGPAHTQALYTGPERASDSGWRKSSTTAAQTASTAPLPMTQSDLLKTLTNKDRMKFAATTNSKTATSSSTSKLDSAFFPERAVEVMDYNDSHDEDDLVKLREEYKLPHKQPGTSFGKTLYNAMEPSSEDSTSLDPAIAGAGAGANTGLYDDDESFGGYYDSVSLKGISGNGQEN